MTKYCLHHLLFSLVFVSFFFTSCNGQVEKNTPEENPSASNTLSQGHPKLLKNLGSLADKGHNVNSSLEDKAGNLWFGTSGDGIYKYDGKSFTQFTTSNGLNSNAAVTWSNFSAQKNLLTL
jgi:ligand-binding sensor domain-containing protein